MIDLAALPPDALLIVVAPTSMFVGRLGRVVARVEDDVLVALVGESVPLRFGAASLALASGALE